jgi:hypothetical protein
MSKRYLGNIITDTPTEPAGPYEDSAAPGIWSLDDAYNYRRNDQWPTPGRQFQQGVYVFRISTAQQIQSLDLTQGTADGLEFGDLVADANVPCMTSNSTRAIVHPGVDTSDNSLEYLSIVSGGTAQDFGDLTVGRYGAAAHANSTRGLFAGGYVGSVSNVIDYVTIASTGNATDFGDLGNTSSVGKYRLAGFGSSTRAVWVSGYLQGFGATNTIVYNTIASTGNSVTFGNDTVSRVQNGGTSNSTRGISAGGRRSGDFANVNTISYVTIASTGNAADFGDMTSTSSSADPCCASSPTKAFMVRNTTAVSIDVITFASTGNATDYGDMIGNISRGDGTSNVHGGVA